jgi:hypothetical protein
MIGVQRVNIPAKIGRFSRASVAAALRGYRFFYLDDFEGQKIPCGKEISDLASLTWCCNLFAAPRAVPENEVRALFG